MLRRIEGDELDRPHAVDEAFADARDEVCVQFATASPPAAQLAQVEALCRRHGARLNVRIYGYAGGRFDARLLRAIPSVASLNLERDTVDHVEQLWALERLEQLHVAIRGLDRPDLLSGARLNQLRALTVVEPKGTLDLAPLRQMTQLTKLFVRGLSHQLAVIGELASLESLDLSGTSHSARLDFVNRLPRLSTFRLWLGSRESIGEVRAPTLTELQLVRIRGLATLDTRAFPRLERLIVQDELRLASLDVSRNAALSELRVINCKNLRELTGVSQHRQLSHLRISGTGLDFDELLAAGLPKQLAVAGLYTGRRTVDRALRARLDALGLKEFSPPP